MLITWDRARWAFAAGVALLVLTAAAAGVLIVQIESANGRIMHAFEIQMALEKLEATMSAAGRARTLYTMTGDPQYLEQSAARVGEAETGMHKILDQTEDIQAHRDFYVSLATLVERRLAVIRASVGDIQAGKIDQVAQSNYANQLAVLGEQISDGVEQMEDHEEQFANERRIVSQRLFAAIVTLLAGAFIVAVSLLYMNYQFLGNELTERRRAEQSALTSQDALRLLSVRLMRTQDEQSRRFSRELHDGLGQYLSLVKMNLARYMQTSSPNAALFESVELLERCIAESRTISYLLHPPLLDDMGLNFATRWYLEGFAERSGIEVNATIPDDSKRLPMPVEITLFRVLQESLTNIHRHSGSKRAEVTLTVRPDEAVLCVKDYGKGIPAELLRQFTATGSHVGVGLAGMRERMREQGGRLEIESNATGTTVTVRVPCTVLAPSATVVAD